MKGTEFGALFQTLKLAAYPLFVLFVSVMPIYLGYVFAGSIMFTNTQTLSFDTMFGNPEMTAKTLFAVMLGDEVFDSFARAGVGSWYAELYMYSWSILFICIIFNVSLVIIEITFFQTLPPLDPHHGIYFYFF